MCRYLIIWFWFIIPLKESWCSWTELEYLSQSCSQQSTWLVWFRVSQPSSWKLQWSHSSCWDTSLQPSQQNSDWELWFWSFLLTVRFLDLELSASGAGSTGDSNQSSVRSSSWSSSHPLLEPILSLVPQIWHQLESLRRSWNI